MSSGLGALERIACTGQISAPSEHLAEEDRPLRIIKLVGFPVGLFSPSQIAGCLALTTATQQFVYGHQSTFFISNLRGIEPS